MSMCIDHLRGPAWRAVMLVFQIETLCLVIMPSLVALRLHSSAGL